MGSFDHDYCFLPKTCDDTNIFSYDINPIMEHKYSQSSHDKDEALWVLHFQFDKLSHEFYKLETWLTHENHNPDSIVAIKSLKKLVNNDDNKIDR